jgi:Raf kinase inhibitor-like YbhB/YbcL family protein
LYKTITQIDKIMTESTINVAYSNEDRLPTFTLKSNEIGGQLTRKQYTGGMGFQGADQSPQLYWENTPNETQAFAVTMYDMDAPTGSGLWHWVVFNIPANVRQLPSGAGNPDLNELPQGSIQSNTDMGVPGYVGAAPPEGPAHRYLITVHALKHTLQLDKDATPALVGLHLHFATLAKASLLVYGEKH